MNTISTRFASAGRRLLSAKNAFPKNASFVTIAARNTKLNNLSKVQFQNRLLSTTKLVESLQVEIDDEDKDELDDDYIKLKQNILKSWQMVDDKGKGEICLYKNFHQNSSIWGCIL